MKYSDILSRVEKLVARGATWPASGDAESALAVLWASALVVARELPLGYLDSRATEDLVLSGSDLKQAPLPDDLFQGRPDLGLISFELDGEERLANEGMDLQSLKSSVNSPFLAGLSLFSLDMEGRRIFMVNTVEGKVTYVAHFTRPTDATKGTLDYPVTGTAEQTAVNLAAGYFEGTDNRQPQMAALNKELAGIFG